ncbi:MAG TPA: holo-ACP synthase [Candidatus Paenibacillus intestinavium]|nr:holo-ACP synthase [Candidatus Paenibacillus intestinavium]
MEIRTGIDLQSVAKMEKKILSNLLQMDSIFTSQELAYSAGKKRRFEHLSARFAAKEAFLKAIGTGMGKGIELNEVGVRNEPLSGKPRLELQGNALIYVKQLGVISMDVSLSHTDELATAQVVLLLERKGK